MESVPQESQEREMTREDQEHWDAVLEMLYAWVLKKEAEEEAETLKQAA